MLLQLFCSFDQLSGVLRMQRRRKQILVGGGLLIGLVAASAVAGVSGVGSQRAEVKPLPGVPVVEASGDALVDDLREQPAEGMPAEVAKACGALPKSYPDAPTTAPRQSHASAVFVPQTTGELGEAADAVVVAQVVSVKERANPELLAAELAAIPAVERASVVADAREQVVVMKLCDTIEGAMPATFTLVRLGTKAFQIESDGPYVVGERYMLYLVKRETTTGSEEYRPVSTEGRLFLTSEGRIDNSGEESPVGQAFDGLPGIEAVTTLVEEDVVVSHDNEGTH